MKTKRTRLWIIATSALFLTSYIGGCKKDNFIEKVGVCPAVVSTNPINNATNVPLNQVITITFNEKMNPATITQASFTLQDPSSTQKNLITENINKSFSIINGEPLIPGIITYYDSTAYFTPSSPLSPNTTYNCTVSTSVKDLMGNALQINYAWTFSTGAIIISTVISTDPVNNATGVVLNKIISATFSSPMDSLSINDTTFILKQGVTPINGIITYSGSTAFFQPISALTSNTIYTATITTGAKNKTGAYLINNYVWTFTTGTVIAPIITAVNPTNNATGVLLNTTVAATFSVPMNPATLTATTFSVKQGATTVSGTISYSGSTATFTPSVALTSDAIYTATITTGARNVAGTTMANTYVWAFTGINSTPPTVTAVAPAINATGVFLNQIITATFSLPMNQFSLNSTTFTVKQGATAVAGSVSYSGTTASFTPTIALASNTIYTVTVTTGAMSAPGISLASNYVWTFTTGSLVAPAVISINPANNAIGVALNTTVAATFSVPMNPSSLNSTTFTVKQGATAITGSVSYSGTTATFTPTIALASNTIYTATITTGATNVPGTPMANNYVSIFTTLNTTPPTVNTVSPENNATGVALNSTVSATFSLPMNSSTLTSTTFTIKQGATTITGSITYSGSTATFTPTSAFASNTIYTATITTGATDVSGIPFANNFVWTFTTLNTTPPTVTSVNPANNATGVALNSTVSATFSLPMNSSTLTSTTFTIKQGATSVTGSYSYSGSTATFTPSIAFANNTIYTATITTGAIDASGISLANNYVWTFTTVSLPPPTVISTIPINNATGVALNSIISANFSTAMDISTITSSSFTLNTGAVSVSGTVTYSGTTATFTPATNLLSGSTYTATITTLAKSLAGEIPLANNYVWSFSTVPPLGPADVDLKSVARFGIIAGVGVSNDAGFSVINNMDVGISPGGRTSITGFPPATIVDGAIYAADDTTSGVTAMLIQAQLDLTAAYLFAQGAVSPAPVIVAGDQGGKTLAPGIYKSTSSLLIQAGNLTLDAQGDVNAVWIFQIASALTTVGGAGGNVILTGGAQANKIFWQVGSSATIGGYTTFFGNVLALTSITMDGYATATGRMLAINGAVVLISTDIINKP